MGQCDQRFPSNKQRNLVNLTEKTDNLVTRPSYTTQSGLLSTPNRMLQKNRKEILTNLEKSVVNAEKCPHVGQIDQMFKVFYILGGQNDY